MFIVSPFGKKTKTKKTHIVFVKGNQTFWEKNNNNNKTASEGVNLS